MLKSIARPIVEALFRSVLRRDGEPNGVEYFVGLMESGATSSDVVTALMSSDEYRVKQPSISDPVVEAMPAIRDDCFRVEMTVRCRDCDVISKVPQAGAVFDHDGQRVQIMHNGLRVIEGGYYGAWTTEIITRLRGHHEPQEELVFDSLMRYMSDDASMIELGGFWSYYSLWFLRGGERRRSLVLEPDPNYLAIGRQNAALNGAAIAFRQGFVGGEDRAAAPFQTESAGTINIPMMRASSLVREWDPRSLDILHCDAQGAETTVIADCESLLRDRHIRFLVVSTHAESITGDALTHQRCLALVRDFGGRVLAEHDVHESFSGDGLIAAYFGQKPLDWPDLQMSRNRYSTSLFRSPSYDLRAARLANEAMRTPVRGRGGQ